MCVYVCVSTFILHIQERTEAGGVQGNVLRMDMELRREKVTADWTKLHSGKLYDLYGS
jgi:hypothetical protein